MFFIKCLRVRFPSGPLCSGFLEYYMLKNILENLIRKIQLQILILKLQLEKIMTEMIEKKKFKKTIPNLPEPEGIVVHVGGGNLDFNQVDIYHRRKWGFKSSLEYYIGYQYFIEYKGKVFQGRRDNERGAHAVQYIPYYKPHLYNTRYIGIGLQGWGEKDTTKVQIMNLKKLIDRLKQKYNFSNIKIIGHREIANKKCPGDFIFNWLVSTYPN